MLPSRFEQPVSITEHELNGFDQVDDVIDASIIMGSPEKAFEFGIQIKRTAAVTSYMLAKLLWKLKYNWEAFGIEGEFEDVVYERIGTPKETTVKYVRMWENIFANPDIPESTKHILMGRPIRDTLLLTAAAKDGMTPVELKEAALAPDRDTIRDMIKRARGEQTSSSTALHMFVVTRDDHSEFPRGTVYVKRGGDGDMKPIAILTGDENDEDIAQGHARLLSVGVWEK